MKMMWLISILVLLFLTGCLSGSSGSAVSWDISGTYARFSGHEFGREYDTLVVTVQTPGTGDYRIVRKWKYERVLDGEPVMPEYKIEVSFGVFNSQRRALEEHNSGSVLYYDEMEQTLFDGSVKYQKL